MTVHSGDIGIQFDDMEESGDPQTPIGPRKKRKLRHPRTAKACLFCKRRKVRCSGTFPCEYCVREEATCDYGPGFQPPGTPVVGDGEPEMDPTTQSIDINHETVQQPMNSSRRNSLDPPQNFAEGHHVGSISGVSFLYHSWNPANKPDVTSGAVSEDGDHDMPSAPLASYGDFPQSAVNIKDINELQFSFERFSLLLERYFRFATPTYRFLHHPTLEKWAKLFITDDNKLTASKKACVLIASAQSLLYTTVADRYAQGGDEDIKLSRCYFERAKTMLDHELGPPSLASVQARLAMCLYLLSTFRMNECRYCFSFAATVLTSLGLHRRQSSSTRKIDLVEAELRKRTFWCAYVLDGYLSVMLGRPRLFRDEDIDQPYPLNIDDQDLMSSESSEDLPMHGNLEAFIGHANLAKLMARNSDLLYPIQSLSEEQVVQRAVEMLNALEVWREELPDFLKPRNKTLTGQRTFERQNTVLKLAYAHVRILATRRSLLADFNRLGKFQPAKTKDSGTTRPIQECIRAIQTIIDAAYSLKERGSLYQSYWFTQYIALVAISTLYVFLIQGARHALPSDMSSFINVDEYFSKAIDCQSHLASQAPQGSQAKRHHRLLDHLRLRVEKDFAKSKKQAKNGTSRPTKRIQQYNPVQVDSQLMSTGLENSVVSPIVVQDLHSIDIRPQTASTSSFDDMALFGSFTPGSDSDENFRNMLDFGWETLDTIGFMGAADDNYDFMM